MLAKALTKFKVLGFLTIISHLNSGVLVMNSKTLEVEVWS